MTDSTVRKFGWFDGVGPLHFLRRRWVCGPRWRPSWGRFFASPAGITLQAHTKKGSYGVSGVFVPLDLWQDMSYRQKEEVLMAWIKSVARPKPGDGGRPAAVDSAWLSEFPALHEYCTCCVGPGGESRRTATVTVFAEHGSWKVWLNDRHTGASLCATSDTVANALACLEVMLEDEDPPWRFTEPAPRPERRRPGRGA